MWALNPMTVSPYVLTREREKRHTERDTKGEGHVKTEKYECVVCIIQGILRISDSHQRLREAWNIFSPEPPEEPTLPIP